MIASAVCFLASCGGDTLYFSYQPIDKGEWEKSDDVHFDVAMPQYEGRCKSFIVLRTNDTYPYKNLSVFVESRRKNDSMMVKRIDFDLTKSEAKGMRHNDYTIPFKEFNVNKDDTIHVRISHNMRTNLLKGITDVGIKIKRCDAD